MSGAVCNDNRFDLIAKYKAKLIEATNIETSLVEMAIIDNILFRMWQMGWLDRLEQPTASPWNRVEEPPNKTGKYVVCWTYQEKIYWDWLIFFDGIWQLREGLPFPDYWMPIEPPKEDA